MYAIYTLLSVVAVSLVAVVAAIPLLLKKEVPKHVLLFLLSMSVGVLLSTVFVEFLPEMAEHGYHLETALMILAGFLFVFVLEKFIHWHHNKKCEHKSHGEGHAHAYHLAPVNLLGDAMHNFIDGLVIAGAYSVNLVVGLTTTISIIFHEVPQEIADFGVLLYSGMSKKKALMFNFFSAMTAIVGALIGIALVKNTHGFTELILPFAAGNFLYIAASNLLPQLHRHCGLKETLVHILSIVLGIALVVVVSVYGPGHGH